MSKPYYNIGGTTQGEFGIRVGSDGVGELRLIHDGADGTIQIDTGKLYLKSDSSTGLTVAFSDGVDEGDIVFAAPDATTDKELQLFGGAWVTDFDDSDPIRGVRLGGAYLALESTDISLQLHSAQVGCRVVVAGLTERGNALLAVEAPPTPDYIANVTNSVDVTIYSGGALPSAWVNVCDLLTITQDIAADEATVFFELLVENTGTKGGVFEIGISLNGAAPTAANSIQYSLSAGIQQIYANTSINASFLANGTTARLQARGISGQGSGFAVVAKNSVRPSRLKVSVVGTGGGAIGANPTASVGLTAVNGTALTWMRSDAAPPLSQSIVPTWAGAHRFNAAADFYGEFRASGTEGVVGQVWSAQGAGLPPIWRTAAGASIDLGYNFNTSTASTDPGAQKLAYNNATYAGTTFLRIDSIAFANFAADTILSLLQAGNRVYMQQRNDATKAAVFEVTGVGVDHTGYWDIPVVLVQSRGTLFINNADLTVVFILSTSSSASANPTGTVGLTVVNGSATTWMRSDAAPPLSVAILPTWTGRHIFGGSDPQIQLTNSGAPTNEKFSSLRVTSAGTVGLYSSLDASSGTMVTAALLASRTGAAWDNISFGNATDNPTFTFVGSGVTTFSAIPVVPNDSWTYAKIQNVSATSRVLGRITSGAGDIEELTGANLVTIIGSGIPAAANPTGTVGLTAVNGSAVTWMRSDAAPPLSQSIVPTWSGLHTFTGTVGWSVQNATPITSWLETDQSADEQLWAVRVTGKTFLLEAWTAAFGAGRGFLSAARGTGAAITTINFGNATDNPTFNFLGTGVATFGAIPVVPNDSWTYAKIQNVSATSRVLGRITSGAGDIEELTGANIATILGSAIPSGANPTGTVGLTAVNGSAVTFLRSDGAPALSVAIVPTWSGIHTFSARPVFNDGITVNDAARQVASLVDTAHSYGNTTDNPTYTYLGSGLMAVHGQFSVGDGGGLGDKIRIRNSTAVGVGTNYHHYFNQASATQLHLYAWDGASTNIGVFRISHVQVYHADGSVANPVITFQSDPDNGLYYIGTNNWGAAAGGAKVMEWLAAASGGAKVADPAGTMENVGYRRVPRSTTTTTIAIGDIGKCIAITAAINIPISVFSAGDAISLYNDSSGALNITISAGTLRLAGSASTGTRSLAARGICTLWFNVGGATPEVIANGNVT